MGGVQIAENCSGLEGRALSRVSAYDAGARRHDLVRQQRGRRREIDEVDPPACGVFELFSQLIHHAGLRLTHEEYRDIDVTTRPGAPACDGTEDVREADVTAPVQDAADVFESSH